MRQRDKTISWQPFRKTFSFIVIKIIIIFGLCDYVLLVVCMVMFKMKILQFFGFSLLFTLALADTPVSTNICPEKSVIPGCDCRQTREVGSLPELICTSNEANLTEVIQSLNRHADGQILQFEALHLENALGKGVKVELTENFFGNITFRKLMLGTPQQYSLVSRVDPNAFIGPIAGEITLFMIRSYELGNDEDLYAAITKLKNLEYLAIEGRYLLGVPKNAFTSLADCYSVDGCGLNKLKKINFTEGKMYIQ